MVPPSGMNWLALPSMNRLASAMAEQSVLLSVSKLVSMTVESMTERKSVLLLDQRKDVMEIQKVSLSGTETEVELTWHSVD